MPTASLTYDFSDHVVIVTGAGGNLGLATARAFATAHAHVVPVDRADDRLAVLAPELNETAGHLPITGLDVTDPAAVQALVERVLAHFGRVDVLVNTVGGYRAGQPLHETPVATFDFLMNLNARSVYIPCQAVIPAMLARGRGAIVNVAARAALAGTAQHAAYAASKAAVVRLTESMAAELKGRGIRVNCVLPGTIDTPQNREAMPQADASRWVAPAAIADVILFLASAGARAIHGAAIPVYGLS
ncbi:MAG: SDR family oxidoreductase [Caldilineales bacterium]|nr:SDR family oxidoreductase [Caldilineales bacterium]MCX7852068.1 SDR family oxidoreductase [Caldilineales bacterium]